MPYFPPIRQEQYPATDETQCVRVIIPAGDEFKALLSGLIVEAADPLSYADPDSVEADGLAAIWDDALSQIIWDGCEPLAQYGNTQIDLFCCNGEPLAGAGTLTYNASGTLPFGYSMSNANTTLFGIENGVYLLAGEYSYIGWSSLTTFGGNTEVALTDGASVIDGIIGAISQGGSFGTRVKSTGTFTVPSDGYYKIVAANNGTGSGSNRQANWVSHHLTRTGD